jgi:Zn finger protein HypA/HybF involved in hydrogenase expression
VINFTNKAMHETHLFKNVLAYLEKEEKASSKRIKKIHVSLSEFGGLSREHFLGHFKEAASGTRWERLEIETVSIPYGPEFEITKIELG